MRNSTPFNPIIFGFTFVSLCLSANLAHAGKVTLPDGSQCEGQFSAGELNGKATCQYRSGEQFIGEFRNGEKEGKGVLTYANGTKIEGIWKAD